ncbi:phage tail protein [Clostridium botulinum]|uniref:Phage tail protein n=1 Tax=Clostridium botulinum TaxID=1491 RepID=A0A846IA53_CLOBO|nr:major tail protein [Clostridium botulinum]EDT84655.1 phage major tail protein, Phi13 family [Clostridium botulinum Bf]NEZ93806.1 phage tail protein [Clostridium botulinum]NFB32658.1 phage tail protein [Clostridium botulinum]NFE32695.1 phage tail protein [Clostridium botulinum]
MDEQVTQVVPVVGFEKIYVAHVLQDDINGMKFDTPRYLPGVKELGLKPKINVDDFYAENKLWLSDSTLANVDTELDITDLDKENENYCMGHKLAEEGGVMYHDDDKAPSLAILGKAIKGNRKARYIVIYNGTFSIGDESYKGKEGKSNFQTKKMKGSFAPLKNNGLWKWKVDEEDGMTDEKFFKEVIIPKEKVETIENKEI